MPKLTELPSVEMLNAMLRYEPETGFLFWKERDVSTFVDGGHSADHNCKKWNSRFKGKRAFTAKKGDGYLHSNLMGKWLSAHRVIWKMVHGVDPRTIDHINGDRSDNRLENLRSVSMSENLKNSARQKRFTNPHVGVRRTTHGAWQAYLNHNGKFVGLGCHDTVEKAIEVRRLAQAAYGYHENHGRNAT